MSIIQVQFFCRSLFFMKYRRVQLKRIPCLPDHVSRETLTDLPYLIPFLRLGPLPCKGCPRGGSMTDISKKTPDCPAVLRRGPEAASPREQDDVFSDFQGFGVNSPGSCPFLQSKKKIPAVHPIVRPGTSGFPARSIPVGPAGITRENRQVLNSDQSRAA